MTGQILLIVLNMLAGVVALSVAGRAWFQRQNVTIAVFSAMMVCVAGWAFFYAGVHLAEDFNTALTLHKIKQSFALLLPPVWFLFTLVYTGVFRRQSLTILVVIVVPVINVILALSNELHGWLYTNPRIIRTLGIQELVDDVSPLGAVVLLYSIVMLVGGLYMLAQNATRAIGTNRTQIRVILAIGLLIFLGAVLEHTGSSPFQHINMIQILFALVGTLILRYLLMIDHQGQIAYDTVVNSLPDAMAVLDAQLHVITANPSFLLMFGLEETDLIGKSLAQKVPLLATLMSRISEVTRVTDYIRAHERSIEAACAPIHAQGKQVQGYVVLCHDVTMERQVQNSLIDSERRYRALFDHSNDAIFIFDLKHVILLANQPASTLLGAPLSQILNKSLTHFIKPDNVATLEQQIRLLLSGKSAPILEQTLITTDGTEIPVEISITLVKEASGAPLSLQMVARDIRERKRAESAIAAERSLLRTLFDSMPDSIFTTDKDGRYTLVNDAHLRRLGLSSADDFIGKQVSDFYEAELAHELREKSLEVIESGYRNDNSEELREPKSWYLVTRAPLFDDAGKVNGLLIVERDINERMAIQNELQRSLEQLLILRQVDEEVTHSLNIDSVGIIALDAALRLSRATAGYIAMANEPADAQQTPVLRLRHIIGGYNRFRINDVLPIDGIAGRAIRERSGQFVPDVRVDHDFVPDVVGTRSVIALPIVVQDRLLGVMQLVCRQADVFTDDNFQFIGLLAHRIAIALDNARLYEIARQQLEELQTLNDTLSNLEMIKTDMIRIASHDLKNPLGIIDGYLNMLEMDKEQFDGTYLEYFDAMKRAVHRMNKILSDILSLERVQQRAAGSYTTLVELQPLVEKAIEEFDSVAVSKSQQLHVHIIEESMPVLGDESQLYEAMSNLISNAIKYTPEGGEIHVRLYEDDQRWIFEVEDNGYGIPEDRQQRLFEAFYRAKAQGTEKIDGTGLGLHLVKNIIERHNGELFFHSTYKQGSLFGFRLEQADAEDMEEIMLDEDDDENADEATPKDVTEAEASTPNFFDE